MSRQWIRENPPHWDDSKALIVGATAGIFVLDRYQGTKVLPGEWWRVEQDGTTLGYGWMDTTWGEAEILLAVDPAARGQGVGGYIIDQLESETAAAGLNYMYNVVAESHPHADSVSAWLEKRGFEPGNDGRLRRRVRARSAS